MPKIHFQEWLFPISAVVVFVWGERTLLLCPALCGLTWPEPVAIAFNELASLCKHTGCVPFYRCHSVSRWHHCQYNQVSKNTCCHKHSFLQHYRSLWLYKKLGYRYKWLIKCHALKTSNFIGIFTVRHRVCDINAVSYL